MDHSTMWWLLAGLLVIAELLTGTFYLLMLALGAVIGALVALSGFGLVPQIVAAALLASAAVLVCYLKRKRNPRRQPASSNRDVNMDVGETVVVEQWGSDGTAQVRYRGATWTVFGRPGSLSIPGTHRVAEVVGNRLLVDKV
ncbi:NfeD family protein [Comamonas testosteroni]|uniref:NfeD family protein n=1 Tax=Comamonas testosteroni TaxID=285 RepID=A0A373FJF9_COMTE|nr:NfeD family protein [Comamonas testosteroni]RGE43652.1 NfeD family protein [Comamonas testosteroni]